MLLAFVVGALVPLYVSSKQIKATTTSAFRQHWIDALRDDLSEYLGNLAVLSGELSLENATPSTVILENKGDLHRSLATTLSRILLRLNPSEEDHAQLRALLERASRSAMANPESKYEQPENDLISLGNRIVDLAQAILKREWNRVKNLD